MDGDVQIVERDIDVGQDRRGDYVEATVWKAFARVQLELLHFGI